MNKMIEKRFQSLEEKKRLLVERIREMTPEQRLYAHHPDAWCALQVAQHLMISERKILRYLNRRPPRFMHIEGRCWTTMKSFVIQPFFYAPIKMRTWKSLDLDPGVPMTLEEIEDAWGDIRENWSVYLSDVPGLMLHFHVFTHPWLGSFSLMQTLGFMGGHMQHHIYQIRRLRKSFEAQRS